MRYVSIGTSEFHCSVGVDLEGSRFHFSVSIGLNFESSKSKLVIGLVETLSTCSKMFEAILVSSQKIRVPTQEKG